MRRPDPYMRHPDLHLALFVDVYGPAFAPFWRAPAVEYAAVVPTPDDAELPDDWLEGHERLARSLRARRQAGEGDG
jgi:hypothetical protein